MAILAECDICGNQHRVKDALAGTSIRCDDCGVKIVVHKDQLITPEAFVDEGGRLRRREPELRASLWTWVVAVVVACAVLIVLVVAIWMLVTIIQIIPKQADFQAVGSPANDTQLGFSNSNRTGVIELA